MPGAGTDKTKNWIETPAPIVVLVEPQLGENIGSAARVMANFGLSRLRLVAPRQGWPNGKAKIMASGADRVLDQARVVRYGRRCGSGLHFRAGDDGTRARSGQARARAARSGGADGGAGRRAGRGRLILFGRERIGLVNEEVALADATVTFPVNPAFASLNLAQAVALMGYEWFTAAGGGLPFEAPQKSAPAAKQQIARSSAISKARSTASSFSARRKSAPPC